MKKILLATTLLAATAGYASAEVAISGSARMGVVKVGADTVFSSRVRIQFDGTGTTDGGLSFGASMRADQNGGNTDGTANGDSTVFVSGSFGKLTMGDVAGGATDELVGQISGVGYTGIGDANEIGFLNGTATAARYDYTSGNLSVALGTSQTTAAKGSDKKSIAVKYATDKYNVAIGYESVSATVGVPAVVGPPAVPAIVAVGANTQMSLKAGVTFGAATLTAKVAKDKFNTATGASGKAEFGVSVDYTVNPALKVTAFYTDHKNAGTKAKGVGASYDLGGGASVVGGIVDNGAATDNVVYDVGVKMTF